MLVLDIMVISRLKSTQWHFYRIHGMSLTRMHKKGHFLLYIKGRSVIIATGFNLLDTKYKFMDSMII